MFKFTWAAWVKWPTLTAFHQRPSLFQIFVTSTEVCFTQVITIFSSIIMNKSFYTSQETSVTEEIDLNINLNSYIWWSSVKRVFNILLCFWSFERNIPYKMTFGLTFLHWAFCQHVLLILVDFEKGFPMNPNTFCFRQSWHNYSLSRKRKRITIFSIFTVFMICTTGESS